MLFEVGTGVAVFVITGIIAWGVQTHTKVKNMKSGLEDIDSTLNEQGNDIEDIKEKIYKSLSSIETELKNQEKTLNKQGKNLEKIRDRLNKITDN